MKFFRHFAILLALSVMIGHDLTPHMDEVDHAMSEYFTSVGSNNGSNDLQHAYSHFKHDSNQRTLVYISTIEKKDSHQTKAVLYLPFLSLLEGCRMIWYANYKKQRFWESVNIPPSYNLHSFSLRGPPTC